ncbi:MAG: two-component regulator propeller domain-containing protein [Bacteroidota bacterium]
MLQKALCLFVFVLSVSAQEVPSRITPFGNYVITNFTADNGLPQNTVDLVKQTADGYIWIGTYAGLARYDGVKFVHYNKSITPAFKLNHVTTMLEDKNGALWFGTNGGGVVRYIKNSFSPIDAFERGGKEYIRAFVYDGSSEILVGTERSGIQRVTIGDQGNVIGIGPLLHEELPKNYLLISMIKDASDRLLVATDIGLVIIHGGTSRILTTADGLPNNSITALATDRQGIVWIGTSNGLAQLSGDKIRTYSTKDGLTTNAIKTLFVDANNLLWIGTDGGGINRFTGAQTGRAFDSFTIDDGLINNFIRTIYQDREGNIWVGTRNGLSQFHIRKFDLLGKKEGLSDSYVRTVFEDSHGRLWVGTNGSGLNVIENQKISIWEKNKSIPSGFIRALYEDTKGALWIGTDGGGVIKYDEGKQIGSQFTSYTIANGLTENYIRAIGQGFDGEIWVATYGGGISRIKGDSILPLTTKQGLANDNVLAMVRVSKNEIWAGTNGGGINKITPNGIETYTIENGLSSNFILSMYLDRNGAIWAGTNGGGINKIDKGTIQIFSTMNGLREDVTLMILEDDLGFMWIGGNQGITRIQKKDFDEIAAGTLAKFGKVDYGRSDGLQNAEISGVSSPCIIKTRDGKIWFTTVGGLACVDPKRVITEHSKFPIHIEQLVANNKVLYPDSLLEFEPGNNSIEFHYTALSYIAPERIRFRYKLVPFNDDWIDAGTRRTAYYTNIPPGAYTFYVNTSTDNGEWSEQTASTSLILQPFFYQTRYFIAIVGFGLILLGAGLYALRTARVHRHAKHLKQLVDVRTADLVNAKDKIEHHLKEVEAARDELAKINLQLDKANKEKSDLLGILSHDFKNKVVNLHHFASGINTGTIQQSEIKEHSQLMELTTQYMLRLIEDTLSSSALEQGQLVLTKTPLDIVQLVELVVLKNRIVMQHKSQTIEFSSTTDHYMLNGSERWLNEAVENLINNAGKFSPPHTTINVSVEVHDSSVSIRVQDHGPGLTEEDKHHLFQPFKKLSAQPTGNEISTGLGLTIVKKIVEMHGGSVRAESTAGSGATFIVELPRG